MTFEPTITLPKLLHDVKIALTGPSAGRAGPWRLQPCRREVLVGTPKRNFQVVGFGGQFSCLISLYMIQWIAVKVCMLEMECFVPPCIVEIMPYL